MIYDLWNDEPHHDDDAQMHELYELEDKILELARNLGEAYDWKRTAPSVISAKAWKIVQDISRSGQVLTKLNEHCKNYLTDLAVKMVEDGFNIEEELRKLKEESD